MFKSKELNRAFGLILQYASLTAFGLFTIFPLLWAVSFGLSSDGSYAYLFPDSFLPHVANPDGSYGIGTTLTWFERVFIEIPFSTYFKNSVIITTLAVIGTVVISVLAAYPLARMRFAGRNLIFVAIIATLMLPQETALVPNYITIVKLGNFADWLQLTLTGSDAATWKKLIGMNSYLGVVLPGVAGAFGIFLMKQAFEAVPQDLIDAARVDGATEMQILWRVMLPVTTPSIAALAIFTLVNQWNEYIWSSIVMRAKDMQPLAVGVFNDLTGPLSGSQNTLMAAIVLTVIPVLIFFAFTQRYFISGMDGAVK
ncbi:carbohydrate ABC transporter permease [Chitinibacter sp. S2-10]|uniref:carbohydrate ABC transporter permease n=1 Tax=Chitinibacter sp. S2-10 TaxID=3373597 RepID=UPI003977A655